MEEQSKDDESKRRKIQPKQPKRRKLVKKTETKVKKRGQRRGGKREAAPRRRHLRERELKPEDVALSAVSLDPVKHETVLFSPIVSSPRKGGGGNEEQPKRVKKDKSSDKSAIDHFRAPAVLQESDEEESADEVMHMDIKEEEPIELPWGGPETLEGLFVYRTQEGVLSLPKNSVGGRILKGVTSASSINVVQLPYTLPMSEGQRSDANAWIVEKEKEKPEFKKAGGETTTIHPHSPLPSPNPFVFQQSHEGLLPQLDLGKAVAKKRSGRTPARRTNLMNDTREAVGYMVINAKGEARLMVGNDEIAFDILKGAPHSFAEKVCVVNPNRRNEENPTIGNTGNVNGHFVVVPDISTVLLERNLEEKL